MLNYIILFLIQAQGYAQSQTFSWTNDACSYTATYNERLITKNQIENTFKLALTDQFTIIYPVFVAKRADIGKLNLHLLKKEYLQKKIELKSAKIANTTYWNKYKLAKEMELEQTYSNKKAIIIAYQYPAMLMHMNLSDDCKNRFVKPLIAGGDSLLKIWNKIEKEQEKSSANPQTLKKEYLAQLNAANKYDYARISIINYGLWNYLNDSIKYVNSTNNNIYFSKLFLKVITIKCDDAD